MTQQLTAIEICAGAGGMALGLEQAGFKHLVVFDNDKYAHATLLKNRSGWNPQLCDVRSLNCSSYENVDLFAAGVPCPPFSIAGQQKGGNDERDLFPDALRLIHQVQPKAVLLENVRGFSSKKFADYRTALNSEFRKMGMIMQWRVLNASDYSVPQLRPRFILVALRKEYLPFFEWPEPIPEPPTVANTIGDLMSSDGWPGAEAWMSKAQAIAPTLVGGSKKHGGADLGPTRAKKKWAELGVDGKGIANSPPSSQTPIDALPRLTLRMAARLQNFPDDWEFVGGKTAQYRQIGNALPPAVSRHVGRSIVCALNKVEVSATKPKQLELFSADVA
ncbi:DNA (cytosine-5-)-methyltransferase [Moorena sp. SIO4G3]|uniref:DNA cytosine methyltransferase n=1 Tax=Moorena sp. SIO4G3 TaxID=2607821 RepID=UPI0025F2DFE1|nr:DNA (cytosine-5-)-methyltransferase [Moorena sp. SIO4G3]